MNILIIGATSGIGKAFFELYIKDNHRIGIVGRRTHLLDELCRQYPSYAFAAPCKITVK